MAGGKGKTKTRRKPRRSLPGAIATFFGYVTTLVLLAALVGVGYALSLVRNVARNLPASDSLINDYPGGVTVIYATDKDPATGKNVVLGKVFKENREFVPISKIPKVVRNATVAIEDERFYSHPGVDLRGIARATYVNALEGKLLVGQGGSTLTQQLARNVFLTQRKTLDRKVKEMLLAIQIEQNYSKEQILEMYLNRIYYGAGAFGVQAASKVYFGRPVQKLSLSQAALIAGLAQLPSRYDPFENKKIAIARRNIVLSKMAQNGYITAKEAKVAKSNGAFLAPQKKPDEMDFKAPYFTHYVVRSLVERYGSDTVYKGGLKVYTTLNWKMQQAAEQALISGVRAARGQRVTEGALVCVEPRTGYIRALVGGVDPKRNEYNNAVQGKRQPGSSFKPFVYTAAFDSGRFGPYSRVRDLPNTYYNGRGSKPYSPKNYGGGSHGWVTVRQALTHSYNQAAVWVANEIGAGKVVNYARRMGITSELEPNLSIALGAYPVSPLEMASAYGVFAARGNRAVPMAVIRVLDHDNEVLESNAPQVEKAAVPETAIAQVSNILGDVVDHGTAAGARGIHEIPGARGKTGTTNDNKDAWFVGFTPELSTAVWVTGAQFAKQGDRFIVTRYQPMAGVTGGHVCAPIWATFMRTAVPIQRQSGEPIPQATPIQTARTDDSAAITSAAITSAPKPRYEDLERTPPAEDSAAAAKAAQSPVIPVGMSGNTAAPAVTTVAAQTPPVIEAPRPAPAPDPIPAPRPAPRLVTVRICSDSGLRATRWCPETVTRTLAAIDAPRRTCRLHRPRPGDG